MTRWCVVLLGVTVTACVERNSRYCGDGICTSPAYPFCDVDGSLAGEAKTCIAVACTPREFVACRGDQAITCDATGNDYELTGCEFGCAPDHGCKDPPPPLPVIVRVSQTGSDANDGLTLPVRTLKRAIGIAATNSEITGIALASGRYEASTGETYPYSVPPDLTIAGPTGGGAILVGSGGEPGLTIDAGAVRDVELEGFVVAITSRGRSELSNVRIRRCGVAVRGEGGAKLTATALDVTGASGACATGIELLGDASAVLSDVGTRGLGSTIASKDGSAATIVRASIAGVSTCAQAAMVVSTSSTFSLSDSLIDGASSVSIRGAASRVSITNTTLRNTPLTGDTAMLVMEGGQIAGGAVGLISGGDWTFRNVAFTPPANAEGIYAQGTTSVPTKLTVRGSTFTGGTFNVYMSNTVTADLGTTASPGNNVFSASSLAGVGVEVGIRVDAAGNSWRPNVQGADATGKYPTAAVVNGPIALASGNNFFIVAGGSLLR